MNTSVIGSVVSPFLASASIPHIGGCPSSRNDLWSTSTFVRGTLSRQFLNKPIAEGGKTKSYMLHYVHRAIVPSRPAASPWGKESKCALKRWHDKIQISISILTSLKRDTDATGSACDQKIESKLDRVLTELVPAPPPLTCNIF